MATLARDRLVSPPLASPTVRALIVGRLAELGGIALALGGILLLIALATYNPHDPSLNTATSRPATNLVGPPGAAAADLLIQGFGLAGVLPGLALLAWAWRVGSKRGFGHAMLRIGATALALPVSAAFLGMLPQVPGWPTGAGLGGAAGLVLGPHAQALGAAVMGPAGALIADAAVCLCAALLIMLGFGLSWREWTSAGRAAAQAARLGYRGGRGTVGVVGRAGRAVSRLADPRAAPPPDLPPLPADPRQPTESRTAVPVAHAPVAHAPVAHAPVARPPVARAPGVEPPVVRDDRRRVVPSAARSAPAQASLPLSEGGWQFPPLSLLTAAPARASQGPSEEALQGNARLLETVLGDYGVQGQINAIRPGPVVTLYELEPAPGIRSARVIGLADDIARSLSVTAVRIATVPGRNVIGIEVPNTKRETVYLSELLASDEWTKNPGKLSLALGKDIGGVAIVADLARMPHLLIAGTTGSGKSVGINAMILSILFRLSPEQCRLIMIDPKMLELSVYEGIPHLMAPVVTEPARAVTALKWTVREMERRYRAMSQLGVRNVGGYNDRVTEARAKGEIVTRRVQTGFDSETGKPTFEEQPLALEPLPHIVLVMDEMADLMMVAGKEVEAAVQRLAQMARAAGIHVIMATQRPSVDVITGTIKANFPTRISFQVISKFDSRTILGEQGAEQLLGHGDMLHMQGGGRIARVHGPLVTDREVEDIVAFLRAQGEPAYVDEVTEPVEDDDAPALPGIGGAGDGEVGLFDQAVAVVAREGKASTSFIQRHLSIGYNRAAKLIEQMEKEGIITAANHAGKREILVRRTNDD